MSDQNVNRVMIGVADLALGAVRFRIKQLEKICDSPIELMLGAAIIVADQLDCFTHDRLIISRQGHLPNNVRQLIPQFRVQQYRADFAYVMDNRVTLIECDGHDFHERTKKQAAHDRSRDRELQMLDYAVLRFTGSEIFEDPIACAMQVSDFVWSAPDRETQRA